MSRSRSRRRGSAARKRKRRSPNRRRPSAATRRRRRRFGLIALTAALAAVVFGYVNGNLGFLEDVFPEPAQGGRSGADGTVSDHDVAQAREWLDELPVADWASMRGYSRDRFPHWRETDGCDVRQRVLARDGEDVEHEADNCQVRDGTWASAFDGRTLTDPGEVDIDHMVPLANAWRTGASEWDEQRREDFANDLERPQLIAVSASSNRAKGDQDPSEWKPSERGYWCRYAHDWVAVKHHWELSVTRAERDELASMLDTCD
jgi:hypothetical protein